MLPEMMLGKGWRVMGAARQRGKNLVGALPVSATFAGMNRVYLALGSNEGDRQQWLRQAIELIGARCGRVVRQSAVYETAAWGKTDQADFLNMALLVVSPLEPLELLATTQQIEQELGRKREVQWGARTLDIDILFYNDLVAALDGLTLPHPFIAQRRFTLVPLNEIAPELVHPALQKTIGTLLAECPDPLEVVPVPPGAGL